MRYNGLIKRRQHATTALRRRVRRWCIQEARRRPNNIARITMPGGWRPSSKSGQWHGLKDYVEVRGLVARIAAIHRASIFDDDTIEPSAVDADGDSSEV